MRTFADALSHSDERKQRVLRDCLLILGGSFLLALSARIQIPGPVPTTLQTFVVVLIGATLGSRRGALTILAYLLQGAVGLPVFALGGGVHHLGGPTAGYLYGFVIAAFVVGFLAERGWDRGFPSAAVAFLVGHALILFYGFIWLAAPTSASSAFAVGVMPFVAGAVLKSVLAAIVLPTAWNLVGRMEPSNLSHTD